MQFLLKGDSRRDIEAYVIDDDTQRIDFARVQAWLASSYWSPGIESARVIRAAQHSALVVGVYRNGQNNEQAAYLRVVSDCTTFAYICDVFVDEMHRGRGLGRAMVQFALDHPELQGLRRWLLATRDAHGVYGGIGFVPLEHAERWMIHLPDSAG